MGRIRKLAWPSETVTSSQYFNWHQEYSNICLDFHGHAGRANLVVFVDGSLFAPAAAWIKDFFQQNPAVTDIFYATISPAVMSRLIKAGGIRLGNLDIQFAPHVVIGFPSVFATMAQTLAIETPTPLASTQGNVFLVDKGNPKGIRVVEDLLRADVRLHLPHPAAEKELFKNYVDSLTAVADSRNIEASRMDQLFTSQRNIQFGDGVHHREAPLAVHEGRADVALMFYHLATGIQRLYPELFDVVCLGEKPPGSVYHPGNMIEEFEICLLDEVHEWGRDFQSYLTSARVKSGLDRLGLREPGFGRL